MTTIKDDTKRPELLAMSNLKKPYKISFPQDRILLVTALVPNYGVIKVNVSAAAITL